GQPQGQAPPLHKKVSLPPARTGKFSAAEKGKGIAPPVLPPESNHLLKHHAPSHPAAVSKANDHLSVSEAESDSSDIPSSDPDVEEGEYIPVRSRHKARFGRDRGPKAN
ncbi:unnamed protein product, partial [Brassica rapa]